MREFYTLLYSLAALLGSPYWLWRALRERKYLSSFRQRLGRGLSRLPSGARPVWLHAVSVGEVLAARPVFLELRRTLPGVPVIVSTVTLTGQELARRELRDASLIFYFPFDWRRVVRRFLERLRPRVVVLLETELWPNFLFEAAAGGLPVLLINGRLSDRSVRRYRIIRRFSARMLRCVTMVGAQSQEDRRRFLEIGASAERTVVTGNLKFDFPAAESQQQPAWLGLVAAALRQTDATPVVVAGSTMRGEEPLFLEAYRAVRDARPETKLILAPRHPERFDEVEALVRASGFEVLRRSQLREGLPACDVLVLDTIGELRTVYGLATVALIGGSFLPMYGGHNPLEPAALGKAVVFGPHMTNFREIAAALVREQAACQTSAESLAGSLLELFANPGARERLGERAAQVVQQGRGATAETMNLIRRHLC